MSDLLLIWIIGVSEVASVMVALSIISIWRARLPLLSDVVVCLLAGAATGLFMWLLLGPGVPGEPLFVDRVTPTTYGPPPPGWTGVPA